MNHQNSPRLFSPLRRGIASLEFVMGAPFIIGLGAAILMVGYAGLKRTESTVQARHLAWKMRNPDEDSAKGFSRQPSEPLTVDRFTSSSGPAVGNITGETTIDFEVYQWLGGAKQAKSGAGLLYQTWDYRQLTRFSGKDKGSLHVEILSDPIVKKLKQATGFSLPGFANPATALKKLGQLVTMDLKALIDMEEDAPRPTEEQLDEENNAKEEEQKKREELERETKKAKAAMDAAYAKWKELKDERDGPPDPGVKKKLEDAKQEMTELLLKKNPKATQAEIDAQQQKIDDLTARLSYLNQEIPKAWEDYLRKKEIYEAWLQGAKDLDDATK